MMRVEGNEEEAIVQFILAHYTTLFDDTLEGRSGLYRVRQLRKEIVKRWEMERAKLIFS
jgi:hypothetical protein